ncbi:MAG: DUF3999 family protein, partial [Giesbergeria sp.]
MIRWSALLMLVALPLAVGAAPPPEQPAAYAAQWPIEAPAGAALLQLALPAEVLGQLQTADARDLRVFNAAGVAVPLALDRNAGAAIASPPAPALIELPARPILGGVPGATNGGVSVRIAEAPDGRVIQLEAPASPTSTPASTAPTLGVLMDARAIDRPIAAVHIDADLPDAQPVRFTLESSSDLQHWRARGEVTVYRFDAKLSTPARVALADPALKDQFLRLRWSGAGLAPASVQVRGALLEPTLTQVAPTRLKLPLTLPASAAPNAHAIEWRLAFATPLAALDIRANGGNTLVPVRVLARNGREQPWMLLARHVVFSLTQDGRTQHSAPVELGNARSWRDWRIEADPGTPGFSTPPALTAELAPLKVVFVASGSAPFTLAAGRADAPPAALALTSLMPQYTPQALAQLPRATLHASDVDAAVPTTSPDSGTPLHQWLLWGVLIAG